MVETPVPLPKPPLRKISPLSSLRTRAEFHSSPADPSKNTKEKRLHDYHIIFTPKRIDKIFFHIMNITSF